MSQSSSFIALPTKTKFSIPDCHCIVDDEWEKTSLLWTIKRFTEYQCEVNETLSSSFFSATTSTQPQCSWYLDMLIENRKVEFSDYIGIILNIDIDTDDVHDDVLVNMKMCILDAEGNEALEHRTKAVFTNDKHMHEYPKFVSKKELFDPDPNNKLLNEDTLTFFCELKFAKIGVNRYDERRRPEMKLAVFDNLSEGLKRLLYNQNFVDVTFVVDGKSFGAHKTILVARSPVFEAMFQHDTQENRLNRVHISDITSEAFSEFLQYMYTDKTPNLNVVTELLVVAEKYQVDSLKVLCEEIISKELSAENAIELLCFADLQRAERLKMQIIYYIKTNPANLMLTQSWKNVILTRPHLFDLVNGVREIKRSDCSIRTSRSVLS